MRIDIVKEWRERVLAEKDFDMQSWFWDRKTKENNYHYMTSVLNGRDVRRPCGTAACGCGVLLEMFPGCNKDRDSRYNDQIAAEILETDETLELEALFQFYAWPKNYRKIALKKGEAAAFAEMLQRAIDERSFAFVMEGSED